MVMLWIKMWTESRGRLPTYLLVGDQVQTQFMHANFFFFLNEYKICLPGGLWILAHFFRGPRIFGLQLMLSEDQRFWILAHVFKGLKVLDPGSCFQRPRIFGSWLMSSEDQGFLGLWHMFSEDQRFWILAHVFRDLGFLVLGSCLQRTRGSESWLMFSET